MRKQFDIIQKIYDALDDDVSKEIFINRLNYSLTRKEEYIYSVIRTLEQGNSILSKIQDCSGIYIFGAGIWGQEVQKIFSDKTIGFIDNDCRKWGTFINGKPVFKIEEVCENLNDILILICTRLFHNEIFIQLQETTINTNQIIDVGIIIDELTERQYFDLKKLNFSNDEVFVDVGSLDGMSALRFIDVVNEEFDKVYCVEPDSNNFGKCRYNLNKYISEDKAVVIKKGAWSKEGDLSFVSQGNGGSTFVLNCEGEKETVEVTTLDRIFANKRVTYIKMDIEGAEYDALVGCKEILKKQKPKLAICIYHKPEDVIEIPRIILECNPEYKLYIRQYSVTAAETVLYAI